MRPVGVPAIRLLVVLMSMSASAEWTPAEMCREKYKTPCPKCLGEGWFQMEGGRCVKAFHDTAHLIFDDAEKECKKYKSGTNGGHLVSIHSSEDLFQVECAMYAVQTRRAHYWIGFRKDWDQDGIYWYTWTDRTKIKYGNWCAGQPDDFMSKEECIEMNFTAWGLWNDQSCDQKRPYVCAVQIQ